MVIGFVDIGGIVDHQCLNFLFIIKLCPMNYVYFCKLYFKDRKWHIHCRYAQTTSLVLRMWQLSGKN